MLGCEEEKILPTPETKIAHKVGVVSTHRKALVSLFLVKDSNSAPSPPVNIPKLLFSCY